MKRRSDLLRLWRSAAFGEPVFPGAAGRDRPRVALALAAIKGCASTKDLEIGKKIQCDDKSVGNGSFFDAIFIANSLIHMYAKCGSLLNAIAVFERMPLHSDVSWNSVIIGYSENGHPDLALEIFFRMIAEDYPCGARTLVAAAMACSSLAEKEEAQEIDGRLVKERSFKHAAAVYSQVAKIEDDDHRRNFVANSVVDMFAKCGSLMDALRVFDGMETKDVISWTTMIMGCVDNGKSELALEVFSRMLREGRCAPNSRTYVAALKACASLAGKEDGANTTAIKVEILKKGMAIHLQAEKRGCSSDLYVASALLDLYSRCGSLRDVEKVFERMLCRDVVAWNTLILSYVENGHGERALEAFSRMRREGCRPDARTFVGALMACSALAAIERRSVQVCGKTVKIDWLEEGMALHSQAKSENGGGVAQDLVVANALVHMYAKCGSLDDSRRTFERMEHHSMVSWNSLILGYVEAGENSLALESYSEMRRQGRLLPNARTFLAALMACGALAALSSGKTIHGELSRCGCLADAIHVFDSSSSSSSCVVAWSSLISSFSQYGKAEMVLEHFEEMKEHDLKPDGMVFSSVLNACSHAGLVDKGRSLFSLIKSMSGDDPDVGHYHCLMDLFGRANLINEAMAVVRDMPFDPIPLTWITILSACNKWKNFEVGMIAFNSLVELNASDDDVGAACLLMQNILRLGLI